MFKIIQKKTIYLIYISHLSPVIRDPLTSVVSTHHLAINILISLSLINIITLMQKICYFLKKNNISSKNVNMHVFFTEHTFFGKRARSINVTKLKNFETIIIQHRFTKKRIFSIITSLVHYHAIR